MATPALSLEEEVHTTLPKDYCLPPLETSTSIRLIDLQLGEQDSDIIMSIATYDLSIPPQYAAFSYTWGDPTICPYIAKMPSRTVWIDEKAFLVTPNLYDGLNHWRGWKLEIGTAKTLLWVDAICINQDDLLERNHQVGLMGQIYSKATLVLSWIGMSDKDTSTALKLISRLKPIVKLWRAEEFKLAYCHNSDQLFEYTGVDMVTREEWEALIAFYERQYFSRAWIVQEIVLAKRAILMLGHNFIHWTDLMDLSVMMAHWKWIPILERYARPRMTSGRPRLTLGVPTVYNAVRYLCEQHASRECGQLQETTIHSNARTFYLLLELLLIETRDFRATNPRDNVYAALSIVLQTFGASFQTTDLLRPDYRLPVHKVFIDVTREITTKTGSVSILSLVDHDSKQVPELPSWVPDYSASDTQVLAYVCGAKLYCAFNITQRSPQLMIVDDTFFLCAMRWETIVEMELPRGSFALQGKLNLCLQLPKTYFNGQTRVEAFWRTLIADTDGEQSPASDDIGFSFHQYVLLAVATRVRKILESWDGQELEFNDFDTLIKLNNNYDEHPDPWLPRGEEIVDFLNMLLSLEQNSQQNERLLRSLEQGAHLYAAAIRGIGGGRGLFKTGGNLLGLAPTSAKRGDTIWFFPSSKVPFVLRHCGGERYKLIGEAYLHGYMHGELEKFSMPLQRISLI